VKALVGTLYIRRAHTFENWSNPPSYLLNWSIQRFAMSYLWRISSFHGPSHGSRWTTPVPSSGMALLLGAESKLFSEFWLISNASDFERRDLSFRCSSSFFAMMTGSTESVATEAGLVVTVIVGKGS